MPHDPWHCPRVGPGGRARRNGSPGLRLAAPEATLGRSRQRAGAGARRTVDTWPCQARMIDDAIARPSMRSHRTASNCGSEPSMSRPSSRPRCRISVVGVPGLDAGRPLGWHGHRGTAEHLVPAPHDRRAPAARAVPVRAATGRVRGQRRDRHDAPRSSCRASTSGRSRSCSGRASRGPRTAPGTPGGHIRSSPPTPEPTSRSCAATRSTSTSRPPNSWATPTTPTSFASATWANYASAWSQTGGFRELLRVGGTYFSSDDHDFWNNAPNPTIIARDTWSQQGRDDWKAAAKALYGAFQRPIEAAAATFKVGTLSFFVADTRLDRTTERDAFATDAQLDDDRDVAGGPRWPGLPRRRAAHVLRARPASSVAGWTGASPTSSSTAGSRRRSWRPSTPS